MYTYTSKFALKLIRAKLFNYFALERISPNMLVFINFIYFVVRLDPWHVSQAIFEVPIPNDFLYKYIPTSVGHS